MFLGYKRIKYVKRVSGLPEEAFYAEYHIEAIRPARKNRKTSGIPPEFTGKNGKNHDSEQCTKYDLRFIRVSQTKIEYLKSYIVNSITPSSF